MLTEIANLEEGVVLLTGDAKKLGRIYLKAWLSTGKTFLAEALPFEVDEFQEQIFIGSPFEGFEFDGYIILNPISRPKYERAKLYNWIKENKDRLILLYDHRYVKDSITRYGIKELINYLVAYKRETMGFERIDIYKFEDGKVTEKKTYMRRK
ncbi:hypothetical protein PAP_04000 [Palaeococcus pacificus DY20341]|uniref:Uncharacterized protein n=1 Tax=Palaeococcus pacificus DY20341 TaxID=1343739 RepID=A0A075LTD8_9EURY|nr:hypothetical protein [Palaeococcus pacificus]AIF69217.1 hypothetical protein PAP_04000 [Palaeococcus pacificus DY20341]